MSRFGLPIIDSMNDTGFTPSNVSPISEPVSNTPISTPIPADSTFNNPYGSDMVSGSTATHWADTFSVTEPVADTPPYVPETQAPVGPTPIYQSPPYVPQTQVIYPTISDPQPTYTPPVYDPPIYDVTPLDNQQYQTTTRTDKITAPIMEPMQSVDQAPIEPIGRDMAIEPVVIEPIPTIPVTQQPIQPVYQPPEPVYQPIYQPAYPTTIYQPVYQQPVYQTPVYQQQPVQTVVQPTQTVTPPAQQTVDYQPIYQATQQPVQTVLQPAQAVIPPVQSGTLPVVVDSATLPSITLPATTDTQTPKINLDQIISTAKAHPLATALIVGGVLYLFTKD